MIDVEERIAVPAAAEGGVEALLDREWLVTNGLGGYASGTVAGVATRRYHALLVAALPAPFGRTVTLCQLWERLRLPDGRILQLGGVERVGRSPEVPGAGCLRELRLEMGLPVWLYEAEGVVLEKRIVMPHLQNTVHVLYRLLDAPEGRAGRQGLRLELEPTFHFRGHEGPVSQPLQGPYTLRVVEDRYEICVPGDCPPLRLAPHGEEGGEPTFTVTSRKRDAMYFRMEHSRGYEAEGEVWVPGFFRLDLQPGGQVALAASTEGWDVLGALTPAAAYAAELERRQRLLVRADPRVQSGVGAELVLAADPFIVTPGRLEDAARARAAGDEPRTVIAGYHWFTDWGRDTMISLEGLTVPTGRLDEARYILRTFAHHVRDGLIPNLFPEGDREGLYHTADASLWYFQAVHRYLRASGDRETLARLLPVLLDIAEHHLQGTRFGIAVDPQDGLLRQGADGYQLTWMDAKVDGWVVTPRRGKAVEINALWYNALRLLAGWLEEARGAGDPDVRRLAGHAERAEASFNRRFWYEAGGHLYDVVDGEAGDDPACRPNQVFAVSLAHPVLEPGRWGRVVEVVAARLLTPVGLRSLAPGHPDYKPRYDGDLRARDAAYHQGTVWGWLIGPFCDAWRRVHPGGDVRPFLAGFVPHLEQAGVGSISEVFDAEPPYRPRGCIAQAWSVAEVLRCWCESAGPERG